MKFLSLVSISLVISLAAQSQNELLVFGGPQASSALYLVENVKQKTSMKYGFQLGGSMKVPFENKLYFAPTVLYSMKGYKVDFTRYAAPPDIDAKNNSTTIHTFEIAPLLQIDFNNDPSHFFIKFGPTLDLQIVGKEKFDLKAGGSVDRSMKFSYGDYGHFGFNFIGQFGYESSNGFTFFAQYSYGVGNINNADYGPSISHRVVGFSIGKYLKRKKIVIDTRNKE